MRFGVLGPVAVWTGDGQPVSVPGRKVRALLAALLARAGETVSADRLVDDLWAEHPPANALGALQAKVSQLRRALDDAEPGGRDLLVSRPPGYVLRADDLDARRFAALVARARDTDDPSARATLLRDALELWRGDPFADVADEAFARPVAARLAEERLAAIEDEAEALLARDEPVALADLVAAHPLRERLRAAHMRALYRAGRPDEALAAYRDLRARLAEELGVEPSPALDALHRSMLARDPELAPARPRGGVPAPPAPLIGRAGAVDAVRQLLSTARLVTLVGPGGVGKTRLAIEVSHGGDGAWFAELAGDRPSVEQAVMAALELREADTSVPPVDRIAAALRDRPALLVLDNCEHVLEPVADLVTQLLAAAPALRVLATSQAPLEVAGEALWPVPPLDPDESRALFTTRAGLPGGTAGVAEICRRLDGLPLALELAATRVRALGVRELADRLDDRFRVLAGRRGGPPRQQTLRATIDWSWELLDEADRSALRRLAVHVDGWALDAAEDLDAVDALIRLVDRSLVVRDGARYRMLESIREYALHRLAEAGEQADAQRWHAAFYTSLAERADLRGAGQERWLRRLDADAGNLRAALAHADPDRARRLVNALTWYWFLRGRLTEALRSLDAVPADPQARAWRAGIALLAGEPCDPVTPADATTEWFLGFVEFSVGSLDRSEAMVSRALEAFRAAGDRWGEATALSSRAMQAHARGDLDAVREYGARSLRLFEELGDRWGQLQATEWLGAVASDLTEAARLHETGLRIATDLGLWPQAADRMTWLGRVAMLAGDYPRARALQERGLALATRQSYQPGVVFARLELGQTARRQGHLDEATAHLEAVLAWHPGTGVARAYGLAELAHIAADRGDPAAAARLAAEAERVARRLGDPAAIAHARAAAGVLQEARPDPS